MSPKVHHCMGGMATNVATAVLDVETDQPIPGLFAAGECVGGIHAAVMDYLVNGRQAACPPPRTSCNLPKAAA